MTSHPGETIRISAGSEVRVVNLGIFVLSVGDILVTSIYSVVDRISQVQVDLTVEMLDYNGTLIKTCSPPNIMTF